MRPDIDTLRDTFQIGYEAFQESRFESNQAHDFYHNRQFNVYEEAILRRRGQPIETFNIIKAYGNIITGYLGTVVNAVRVYAKHDDDVDLATLLNDLVDYTFRKSLMETEGDKIKMDGILSGIMVSHNQAVPKGEKDRYGRPLYDIQISHVPAEEIILDPKSRLEDYSDAKFIHRFKWISEEVMRKLFPDKKEVIKQELIDSHNFTQIEEADFHTKYNVPFTGEYRRFRQYLVVHSIIVDDDADKVYSCFWSDRTLLKKQDITHKLVKFPYRVQKIYTSNKTEYYGLFREAMNAQRSINQAVSKIQLAVNSKMALVAKNAVDDIQKFTDELNSINSVIEVNSIEGIKIIELQREIQDQYTVIDKTLDRIQKVLGINDSFLGIAFASDSGRKVKLQQNSTIMSLRQPVTRIEQFYRLLGRDIINMIQQYYTAEQAFNIIDPVVGARFLKINQPLIDPRTQQPVFEYVIDPETGRPLINDNREYVVAPVPTRKSEIYVKDVDITVDTVIYNDEEEKTQLLLESVIGGPMGEHLAQVDPAGYLNISAMLIESYKTKRSKDMAEVFKKAAEKVGQTGEQLAPSENQQKKSRTAKLPAGDE